MNQIERLLEELSPDGVPVRALGEVAELVRGNGMPKTDLQAEGIGAIHYGQIYTRYGVWTTSTLSFVTPTVAAKLAKVNPGDVIITNTSENLDDVGKAVAWLGDEQIVTGGHATVIRHGQDPKYLAYWFQSESFYAQKAALATGTKVMDVSARQLAGVHLPIPPLPVQREVVRILDSFRELADELSRELRIEVLGRRRQFGYFRDVLLSFGSDVAMRPLAELAKNLDRARKPVTRAARTAGPIPYYGASGIVDYVSDFIFDGDYLLVSEDGANLLARSTPIAFAVKGKTWVNNHAHVLEFENFIDQRFVEIYLNSIDLAPFVSGAAQPKLNQFNLARIAIPDPPYAEKQRIVAIFDQLEGSMRDLEGALTSEIEDRRHQYAHYRNRLLSFSGAAA